MASRWHSLVPAHMAAATATAVALLVVAGILSCRHAGLAVISGSRAAFAVSVRLVFVGSVPSIFLAAEGFGLAFWLAHLLDIVGVFLAAEYR